MNTANLIELFSEMAETIDANREYLCELDGVIGDADHGVTMSIGFKAVRGSLSDLNPDLATPSDVFNTAARSFLAAVGASAGPLYATAFMRAGAALKGQAQLNAATLATAIEAMAEGIQFRGKAEAGDKTMLDVWKPAAETAARMKNTTVDLNELMTEIAKVANEAAASTTNMLAKKGRAAKLGERSIGHRDAGAVSSALLLNVIANYTSQPQN